MISFVKEESKVHWKRLWCWGALKIGGKGGYWGWHMVEWHHRLNGHEFDQTQVDSEGQGTLASCSSWGHKELDSSVQSLSCVRLCDSMDCSTPGFPIHYQLLELTQTHICLVGDAIQPSHPLSSPSPPAFNLAQHQGLFQWVSSLYQVSKVLEFQLQHQSFQWIFRTDIL